MITRTSTISGKISFADSSELELNDGNLVKDTLYIENQCVNNEALEFGTVYAAECGFTLRTNIDRYKLFNAVISISHTINGKLVKMGDFIVYDSNRAGQYVSIKAIDKITEFDVETVEEITGRPYQILKILCDNVRIPLANTEEEISALPNGTRVMRVLSAECTTYRIAISQICAMICSFAIMDPEGRLRICQYEKSPSLSLERSDRLFDCTFNDFTTSFKGVKCRFLANENYYPYSQENMSDRGIYLDLGDISVLSADVDEKNAALVEVLNYVKDIGYVPSELNVPAISDLRLGQMIQCNDINGTTEKVNTIVMKYSWNYRQKEVLNSYGENPRMQNIVTNEERQATHIVSSSDASNADLTNKINTVAENSKLVMRQTANTSDVAVSTTATEVVKNSLLAYADTQVIVYASVNLTLANAGVLTLALYSGSTKVREVKQFCGTGYNCISLMGVVAMGVNDTARISVKCAGAGNETCGAGGAWLIVCGQKVEVS